MMRSLAALAGRLEERFPAAAHTLKRWFTNYGIPANRALGIRVDRVDSGNGEVHLHLRNRRRNLNVGGTVHGGAVMALAESVHGVAVLWHFSPTGWGMVTRSARIEFLAPARGRLFTAFAFSDDLRRRIERDLAESGRSDLSLTSVVRDAEGREVARLEADYRVSRRGSL